MATEMAGFGPAGADMNRNHLLKIAQNTDQILVKGEGVLYLIMCAARGGAGKILA